MATSEHFHEHELRCRGRACCGRVNLCEPELLGALEAFRAALSARLGRDTPVIVISGYRCPEHNKRVGGAKNSMHVQGLAADVRVAGVTAAVLEQVARTIPAINGIGRDDHGNDLHMDVRSTRAAWCYSKGGTVVPYYPAPGVTKT